MARKRKRLKRSGTSTEKHRVKGHTRSPRGPDTKNGKRKKPVRVKPYRRRKPLR